MIWIVTWNLLHRNLIYTKRKDTVFALKGLVKHQVKQDNKGDLSQKVKDGKY